MAALKHLWETEGYFIVISNIKRLQFNIQEHSMVPKHRIMKKDEIKTLKNFCEIPINSFIKGKIVFKE